MEEMNATTEAPMPPPKTKRKKKKVMMKKSERTMTTQKVGTAVALEMQGFGHGRRALNTREIDTVNPAFAVLNLSAPVRVPAKDQSASKGDGPGLGLWFKSCPSQRGATRIKSAALFALISLLLGVYFILARLVASWAWSSANPSTATAAEWWWWWKSDVLDLFFFFAVLSAATHAAVNVSGGISASQKTKFAVSLLFGWFVIVTLCATTPQVYEQVGRDVKSVEVDRGNCSSLKSLHTTSSVLDICFMSESGRSAPRLDRDVFVQFAINGSRSSDVEVLKSILKSAKSLRGLAQSGQIKLAITFYNFQSHTSIVKEPRAFLGYFEPECFNLMMDLFCLDTFEKCDENCEVAGSKDCFRTMHLDLMDRLFSCLQRKCETQNYFQSRSLNCSNTTRPTVAKAMMVKIFSAMLNDFGPCRSSDNCNRQSLISQAAIDEAERIRIQWESDFDYYVTHRAAFHSKTNHSCGKWRINLTSAFSAQNTGAPRRENARTTCDPLIDMHSEYSTNRMWEAGLLLAFTFLYFACAVVFFAASNDKEPRLHFECTCVRRGSLAIGLFMSGMIYVGSLHLYRAALNSTEEDSLVFTRWRGVYLFLTYLCAHGSLLVALPRNRGAVDTMRRQGQARANTGTAIHARNGGCCGVCCANLAVLQAELWDATGKLFWLKLVIMEVLDIVLQLNSITTSAPTSNVGEVAVSAAIIATNLMVLPIMIAAAPFVFKYMKWSDNTSTSTIVAMMLAEVLFDKTYVCVGVLLRFDTLIDNNMDFPSQMSVHCALLIPALMTALDVSDALTLSKRPERKTKSKSKQHSFFESRISSMSKVITQHPAASTAMRTGLALSFLVGLSLAVYISTAVQSAHMKCEERIGKIASCASHKYYFGHGLFSETTCAFERVRAFECVGDDKLGRDALVLPDAEGEYAQMRNLILIKVPNSSLIRAPIGWSRISSSGVSIDVSDSAHFSGLPVELCFNGTNLKDLNLKGTIAGRSLNWAGSLRGVKFESSLFSGACAKLFSELRILSLASNGLSMEDLDPRFMSSFNSLVSLDLSNNRITAVDAQVASENFIQTIINRFVDSNAGQHAGEAVSIKLSGNPLEEIQITAVPSHYVKEWVRVLQYSHGMAHTIKVGVVPWPEEEMISFSNLLPGSRLRSLQMVATNMNLQGLSALVDSLVKSNVTSLNLGSNFVETGDQAAQILASSFDRWNVCGLNLVNNNITDFGVAEIARALPKAASLAALFLDQNELIGDKGAKSMAEAVSSSPTNLELLFMGETSIRRDGIKALAEALPKTNITKFNAIGFLEGGEDPSLLLDGARALLEVIPRTKLVTVGVPVGVGKGPQEHSLVSQFCSSSLRNADGMTPCVRFQGISYCNSKEVICGMHVMSLMKESCGG